MILFYPLHYKSRQGKAEGEVFPKMQLFVPCIKHHFHGVLLPHPRFKGERSINHYPKYSLILRVFYYPTQRGRGETPDCPSFIQLLGGPGLPLLNAADFLGLSLPHPRGEEERPWTPTILNPASFLESFILLPPRGEKERPQSAYPKLTTQPHTHGPLLPHPIGEEEKPWTPLSKIQPHS